jgi:iron(III) transport system substrate-binding protein
VIAAGAAPLDGFSNRDALSLAMNSRLLLSSLLGMALATAAHAAEVNVYSARQEALIKPQLDAFTKETGIEVNLVTGNAKELVQRMKAEGANSPADLFFTTDAGNMHIGKEMGLFQKVSSPAIEKAVPAKYRDPDGMWVGLGVRARPIFYVPGKVDPEGLATYADLADPRWKDEVLIRSSSNIYNQSLLASIIAHEGPEKAEAWAKGVVANLARKPQGGDRDQLKAAAAGEGSIAVVNTYYYAGLLASSNPDDKAVAEKLKVIWPNQDGRGTHVNVSGAAMTASAKNKAEAVKLLEFLVGEEAQKIYAEVGQEYPVRAGVEWSPILQKLGEFKADDLSLAELGRHNAEAVRIFDRVGWR